MHPRVIAERQAIASQRVLAAVDKIAANTNVAAPNLAGIREKSPDVQRIKEWEALADWLEGVADGTAQAKVPRGFDKAKDHRLEAEDKRPPVTVKTVVERPMKTTETVEIKDAGQVPVVPRRAARKEDSHAKD